MSTNTTSLGKSNIATSHPAHPQTPATYGPAYDLEIDGKRLNTQLGTLASFMEFTRQCGMWVSLAEIEKETGIPQASASAQLRHLRKPEFGSNIVEKRRRDWNLDPSGTPRKGGTWEYRVTPEGFIPKDDNPDEY